MIIRNSTIISEDDEVSSRIENYVKLASMQIPHAQLNLHSVTLELPDPSASQVAVNLGASKDRYLGRIVLGLQFRKDKKLPLFKSEKSRSTWYVLMSRIGINIYNFGSTHNNYVGILPFHESNLMKIISFEEPSETELLKMTAVKEKALTNGLTQTRNFAEFYIRSVNEYNFKRPRNLKIHLLDLEKSLTYETARIN